jgi:AraC-like DNA-binding protein
MVVFYPDAFAALFDVDLAALQNRFIPARDILPPRMLELVDSVFAAQCDAERQSNVERYIEEYGQVRQLPAWLRVRRMGSRITLAIATRILGIGARQMQRLAVRKVGTSLQTLIRLKRGEQSFLSAQRRYLTGDRPALAEHALESGYADQSHMVRECKEQTGRSPAQLARDTLEQEADWVYRLNFPDDEAPTSREEHATPQ